MASKSRMLLLAAVVAMQFGCARTALHQDFGKAVSHNKIMQTENLNAPNESHPDVKMDGQKASKVVENYRKEKPQADATELTK